MLPRMRHHRGIALIAVLWLVALLTLLASAVAALTVSHRRATERYAESVAADALADSAIRVVLLRLFAAPDPSHVWPIAQSRSLSVLGSEVAVTVTREAGRIDLNTADPELLFALFAVNGWSDREAQELATRVIAWRGSPDALPRRDSGAPPQGAAPARTPFENVSELPQVLHGARLSAELLDACTVYSHLEIPLVRVSPVAVRRALVWADEHQLGGHRWIARDLPAEVPTSQHEPPTALTGEVLRLQSCPDDGSARCRTAIVRLTSNNNNLTQVFVWETESVGTF